MLRQDMAFFDKPENAVGALTSKLSTQPTQLQELLGFNMPLMAIVLVNLVSSCLLALIVGWKFALVVIFGALSPIVLSGYLRIRIEVKFESQTGHRFAESAALASEAISSIRTVASFTLEGLIMARYWERLDGIVIQSMKSIV